ncbi:hypothetical protein KQX54_002484 [Cotesia glomerata]|uniref:Uncharacterized protein n=1 Tax=Cotesia glomerata TaxID=32391 RepID=A0AAV7IAR9_COTGL|nr:hypothetical protein KQX54_002484 [Cotesia glomerata]
MTTPCMLLSPSPTLRSTDPTLAPLHGDVTLEKTCKYAESLLCYLVSPLYSAIHTVNFSLVILDALPGADDYFTKQFTLSIILPSHGLSAKLLTLIKINLAIILMVQKIFNSRFTKC